MCGSFIAQIRQWQVIVRFTYHSVVVGSQRLLHVTLLVPKVWRWLLDFRKICGPSDLQAQMPQLFVSPVL